MAELILLCGPAGSGKSTYIKKRYKYFLENTDYLKIVSRDAIRFEMVKENEQYFSREKEVFNEFVREIQEELDKDCFVFADATHLNEGSRNKLLDRLNLENVDISIIAMATELDECLRRNSLRHGREFVPETVIKNMYESYIIPTECSEKYKYKRVVVVY